VQERGIVAAAIPLCNALNYLTRYLACRLPLAKNDSLQLGVRVAAATKTHTPAAGTKAQGMPWVPLRCAWFSASLMSLLFMPLIVVLVLQVQGGGNCANALTAAAQLGLSPTIVTKVRCSRRNKNRLGRRSCTTVTNNGTQGTTAANDDAAANSRGTGLSKSCSG
jgi:hypothetical protein